MARLVHAPLFRGRQFADEVITLGLPYGQDRLIPIYLATLAIRQRSQSIRFRSGARC